MLIKGIINDNLLLLRRTSRVKFRLLRWGFSVLGLVNNKILIKLGLFRVINNLIRLLNLMIHWTLDVISCSRVRPPWTSNLRITSFYISRSLISISHRPLTFPCWRYWNRLAFLLVNRQSPIFIYIKTVKLWSAVNLSPCTLRSIIPLPLSL